jgi:hypothetical protein
LPEAKTMTAAFEILNKPNTEERERLFASCVSSFASMAQRYMPQNPYVHPTELSAAQLDELREAWFTDDQSDKPALQEAHAALSWAYGELLRARLAMQWCHVRNQWGESISVIYLRDEPIANMPSEVMLDPFNYVAKRMQVEHFDVLEAGFDQVRKIISEPRD